MLWQERQFSRAEFRAHEHYWTAQLAGVRPPELPIKPDYVGKWRCIETTRKIWIVYGDNGRGKTSLLNAFRYALYGKVLGRRSERRPGFNGSLANAEGRVGEDAGRNVRRRDRNHPGPIAA